MKISIFTKIILINLLILFFIAPLSKSYSSKITDIQEGEWVLGNIDAPITMMRARWPAIARLKATQYGS